MVENAGFLAGFCWYANRNSRNALDLRHGRAENRIIKCIIEFEISLRPQKALITSKNEG